MDSPANREVVEGCLVLIVGASREFSNIGKIATAVKKVYHGDIVNLGGLDTRADTSTDREEFGWLLEGESLTATINTHKPYNPKGWAFVQPRNIIPIYPEEDDQYLEELLKEGRKCEA